MTRVRSRDVVAIGSCVAAGLTAAAIGLGARGADDQFLQAQRHPPNLSAAAVERVVVSAPDPQSGKGRGQRASCTGRGSGPRRNPWKCVVRYPGGTTYRLTVQVQDDGTYDAFYVGVKGAAATGCCIDLPGTK
jgi:hypothetical protein